MCNSIMSVEVPHLTLSTKPHSPQWRANKLKTESTVLDGRTFLPIFYVE